MFRWQHGPEAACTKKKVFHRVLQGGRRIFNQNPSRNLVDVDTPNAWFSLKDRLNGKHGESISDQHGNFPTIASQNARPEKQTTVRNGRFIFHRRIQAN
jgi:hypothetical protein